MSTGLRRQSFRSKSKSNLARIQNRDQKSGRFISKKTAGLTPNSDEYVIESNRLSPRAAESRKNSIQSRRTWESSPESLLDSVLVRTPQSKSNRNSKNSKQKSKNSAYARRLVVSNLSQIEEDESERKSQWVEDENSKPSVNAKRKLENSLKEIELSEKLPHKMVDTQGGKKRFENSEVHSEESSKPLNFDKAPEDAEVTTENTQV